MTSGRFLQLRASTMRWLQTGPIAPGGPRQGCWIDSGVIWNPSDQSGCGHLLEDGCTVSDRNYGESADWHIRRMSGRGGRC